MRFLYLDAGLLANVGHHASYCRMLANEARNRGIETHIFGHIQVVSELIEELGVIPFFSCYTYSQQERSKDPIAGWLRDFEFARQQTLDELRKLGILFGDDVVYMNTAYPGHICACMEWLKEIQCLNRPRVVFEFGTDPGINLSRTESNELKVEIRDPRRDPRAILYRFAASSMDARLSDRVNFITFDRFVSSVFQAIVGLPVRVSCWPHDAVTSVRSRVGRRPINVGILGHQRHEKGFQFVPDVLRCFTSDSRVSFLIQNAAPAQMAKAHQAVLAMTKTMGNIALDQQPRDGAEWANLLEQTDLMLCPYDPVRYSSSHSAVMAECLANGIPAVVPSGTVLANMASQYGSTAVVFDNWNADSITAALRIAVEQFDQLANRAASGAKTWAESQGTSKLLDQILGQRSFIV